MNTFAWTAHDLAAALGLGHESGDDAVYPRVSTDTRSGTRGRSGTPIPTSVVLTGVLAFAAWQDRLGPQLYGGVWVLGPWQLHPLSLLFIASGSMMISKTLRIPKP